MPGHRHAWQKSNQGDTRRCMECGEVQYLSTLLGGRMSPPRGTPQDHLPPQSIPPLKVTGPKVFDAEQFKIASARMSAGMISTSEMAEKLSQRMRDIAAQAQAQVWSWSPPPFSVTVGGELIHDSFGNREIEASPSEALDIIVRYLRYVAKERPDELRQVASKWMTKMTDAVTGVLKEAEEGESQ